MTRNILQISVACDFFNGAYNVITVGWFFFSLTKVGLFLPSTRSYVLSIWLFPSSSPKGTSTLPRSLKRLEKKKRKEQNNYRYSSLSSINVLSLGDKCNKLRKLKVKPKNRGFSLWQILGQRYTCCFITLFLSMYLIASALIFVSMTENNTTSFKEAVLLSKFFFCHSDNNGSWVKCRIYFFQRRTFMG